MPDLRDEPFVQSIARAIDSDPEPDALAEHDRQTREDETAQRLARALADDVAAVVAEALAHADAEALAWLDALARHTGVASMDAVLAEARRRLGGG